MNKSSILPYKKQRTVLGICCVFVLAFSACNKDLIERPRSVVAENFYNTAAEVQTAVGAVYSDLRANNHAVYIGFLDIISEYGYGRGSYAQVNDFQAFNTNNVNRVGDFWNLFYLSIRDANLVIKNAPHGKDISQADITSNVAEARFLRALCYFHLVRCWGGVPLRTEENMDEPDLKRSSVDSVYQLILSDLNDAVTNLPQTQAEVGRPTRYAAETMLADVDLNLGKYADAATAAEAVISSGKYGLVPVTSTEGFQKIFGPDVTTTPEEVFYLKYTRQIGQGNYMLWILNHPSTNYFNFGGSYANYGDDSIPFYKNWNNADLRKGMWDTINFGLGNTTLVCNKYRDNQAVSKDGAGNDQPEYRYAEVLLIYAEAACRAAGHPTAEAMEALNEVHRRAYGQNPTSPSAVDFKLADYDEDSFIDLVIQERGYEFQYEGKRWFTLKRTGKFQEAILENRKINIPQAVYLWPIPVAEFNFNKALDPKTDQNPGY